MVARVSIGDNPEFSANAMGTVSRAFAKARIAYCSIPGVLSAASATAREQAISAAPPP
jgi:precorrin-4 methylase